MGFFAVLMLLQAQENAPSKIQLLDGVAAVVVVDPAELAKRNVEPAGGFAISPDKTLVLRTRDNLYDVTRQAWFLKKSPAALDSFAFFQGSVVTVTGEMLGSVANGEVKEEVRLPEKGMMVTGDGGALYVYGGAYVYRIVKGGEYEKVVEAHAPVAALAVSGDRLFLGVKGGIYTATVRAKEPPGVVYRLPPDVTVRSLAYDPARRLLYFSARDSVCAVTGPVATVIASNVGGDLLFREDILYVLDAKRKTGLALSGMAEALFPKKKPEKPTETKPKFKD